MRQDTGILLTLGLVIVVLMCTLGVCTGEGALLGAAYGVILVVAAMATSYFMYVISK